MVTHTYGGALEDALQADAAQVPEDDVNPVGSNGNQATQLLYVGL
ncbi:protein of unknown function [Bradyrhizobium vignae]|uniref:Uncharacterized protein n=1 Tax=Bradyrhizobium vignae TaxID=1549949 RepID=A0A2U3PUP8_9BRAD|nr:protein of unknown function [Bradyrhizobium vignae]